VHHPSATTTAWSGPCWERSVLTALVLLAAGLALTGVAGPLADPHFAERQLGHEHLFTDGEGVPHTHDATGAAQGGGDTVYLPPDQDPAPGLSGFGAAVALTAALVLAVMPLLRTAGPRLAALAPVGVRPPGPPPPRGLLTASLPS
jgi:hypothetical protein